MSVQRGRRLVWPAALALAVLLPVLLPYFTAKPGYLLQVVATAFISAISVYGLNVILGYTGLLNLAHASFFGIGAYAVALLETKAGWAFYPALLAAVALSVLFGFLVGIVSLRTRGNYFAIFTAAVGVMISIVFTNWQDLTGGNIGIVNIPGPPALGPISFDDPVPKYYMVLAALAIAIGICALVRRSLLGRSFAAVASNEDLARACGIDATRVKLLAFMISTGLAGLAGAMFAAYVNFLGPDTSGLDITFEQLIFLVVGGLGTIAGPLLGTLPLAIVAQALQGMQQYRFLVYGPLLVALIIFFPRGLAGAFTQLRLRSQGRAAEAAAVAAAPEAAV